MSDWTANLVTENKAILDILRHTRSIAVLGIKPETHGFQPAHYVPAHMASAGYEIIPVPVYYPEVNAILGKQVYRKLTDIKKSIDMVNVFRRPDDIPPHVDEILALKPKFVWFQLGIRNDDVAEQLAKAWIKVVQDRCLMVEQGRL